MTKATTEHYKELLLALICALLALWGVDRMVHNLSMVLTGLRTPGVIVSNDLECGRRSCEHVPVVRFVARGGQTYEVRSTMARDNPPEYHVGQNVTVYYDPRRPESALINSWEDLWLLPLGVIVMGTFFGLVITWPLPRLLLQRIQRAPTHTRKSNIRPRRSAPARRHRHAPARRHR